MKMQTLNYLATCLVAAAVALTTTTADCQEVQHMESMPVESMGHVGDMSCSSCGSTVSEDGGLLRGQCPNCGGRLGHGSHGAGGGLRGAGNGGLFGRGRNGEVDMQIHERGYGRPDLFYNYYTQGFANRANAQMYLAPVPVPPNVGHTFYTYQPFLPQHMLYPHVDKYHRYYDGGRGKNRTSACLLDFGAREG